MLAKARHGHADWFLETQQGVVRTRDAADGPVADQIDQMTAAVEEAGYDEDQAEAVATLAGVNRDYMAKALNSF